MKGGFVHNEVLLGPFMQYFQYLSATVYREYPVGPGTQGGFIDGFVLHGSVRIAFEAELSPDRVLRDVEKARQLKAHYLFIIVPESHIERRVKRKLAQRPAELGPPEICVLPLGQMLQRISELFPNKSDVKYQK